MTIRSERGQATALTVLCITALLGMAALVLDVGSWYRAQRATQATADAAALAAAHALPHSTGEASALAAEYLAKNGGGDANVTFSTRLIGNDTVNVRVTRNAPGVFARLFGIDSVDVGARATARASGLAAARYAAPIAVDERHPLLACDPVPCFNEDTTLDLEKVGPGAFRLINLDDSHGGTGPGQVAEWIRHGFDGYMPLDWYYSDPGAKFSSSQIKDAMQERIGDELLFPVYRRVQSQGSNFEYQVVGWVGFVVTGFSAQGNKGTVSGRFVRIIWEGIEATSGGTPNYGARAIRLVE